MMRCFALMCLFAASPFAAYAQDTASSPQIESITIEGGPIASKHFQSGDEHFRERHGLGIAKVHTKDYGNWGIYFLNPNSVDDTSIGVGYVTNPYTIPIGSTKLELSGAIGLVSGYQNYPVPLLAGEVRWVVYENGPWDAGASMAAMPYIMEDRVGGDNKAGIVVTSPFLSVRYRFQ